MDVDVATHVHNNFEKILETYNDENKTDEVYFSPDKNMYCRKWYVA